MNHTNTIGANGGVLRGVLEHHAKKLRLPQHKLQVMHYEHDPFFMDRDSCHRDAQWFAQVWQASGLGQRPEGSHLRSLHYVLISQDEPPLMPGKNKPYRNTHKSWMWLVEISNKARWLGYVGFDEIIDERNDEPININFADPSGMPQAAVAERSFFLSDFYGPTKLHVERSSGFSKLLHSNLPNVEKSGFYVPQPYRLALIGEKSSLRRVLEPIARRFRAELILPTGDLSQSLFWGMCKRADQDGRPLRIFYAADFDPSGQTMGRTVGRKLQAMINLYFPNLDVQLRRVALTAKQVRDLNLPSTPLKETEQRADRWRERFGVEQTEIDALATLRPDAFEQIVTDALKRYYDPTLGVRVRRVETDLSTNVRSAIAQAFAEREERIADLNARIDELNADGEDIDRQIDEIQERLDDLNQQIAQINERQRPERDEIEAAGNELLDEVADAGRAAIEDIELPEPQCDGDVDEALFDSRRDWGEQTLLFMQDRV
jgi:hypothetical protein